MLICNCIVFVCIDLRGTRSVIHSLFPASRVEARKSPLMGIDVVLEGSVKMQLSPSKPRNASLYAIVRRKYADMVWRGGAHAPLVPFKPFSMGLALGSAGL